MTKVLGFILTCLCAGALVAATAPPSTGATQSTDLSAGPKQPGAATINPGSTDNAALQFKLTTTYTSDVFYALTINNSGSAGASDFDQLTLYRDANANGVVDSGDTVVTKFTSGSFPLFSDFSANPQTITSISTVSGFTYLVCIDVSSGATSGATFDLSINPKDVTCKAGTVGGSTVTGATQTVGSSSSGGPQITTTTLPNGTVGTSYNQTISATGGSSPYTWKLASGNVPTGLTLDTTSTTLSTSLSGTPSTAGSFSFVVEIGDSQGRSDTQPLTVTIDPTTVSLTITTTSLPNGTVGTAYNQNIDASGGKSPYSWSLASGNVPPGLTLDTTATGVTTTLAGTPTTAGTYTFTVQVDDSGGASATQPFTVDIAAGSTPLSITTTALNNGATGTAYSENIDATGGTAPYSWSLASGSIPGGLTLDTTATGLTTTLSGTPTTAGTFNFTVQIDDSAGGSDSQPFTVDIVASGGALTIITTTLSNGTVGTPYSDTIDSTGGSAPYTWSLASGTLPPGLTLDTAATTASTTLSGTPTSAGSFSFTVQVADGSSNDTQVFNMSVASSGGGGGGGVGGLSGGSGGGGGGGGCTAGDSSNGLWLALAALAAALSSAAVLRRVRA